jgi:hypothetical protein
MEAEQGERLRALLEYWITHNEEHGAEFEEWAEKATGPDWAGVREALTKAREGMDGVNEWLGRARAMLRAAE